VNEIVLHHNFVFTMTYKEIVNEKSLHAMCH